MDLSRLFTVYRPFDHEEFLRSLKQLRFQDSDWLFEGTPRGEALQGDVLAEVEIAFTNADGGADLYVGSAMLLGNSCDAVPEQDPVVAVAPVLHLEQFVEQHADRKDAEGLVDLLRRNRLTSRFYLPAIGSYGERFVDFAFTAPISTQRLNRLYIEQREEGLRLSERGWWLLTGKLAHHFSRGSREE